MSKQKPDQGRSTYHHGELKKALIDAAIKNLEETGVDSLSLRKLAQDIGVSHNAPYMHFANRQALLAEIALQGFRDMTAQFEVMKQPEVDWYQRLKAGCLIYVQFGIQHPGLFQVMFMEHDYEHCPELHDESLDALKKLTDAIAEGQAIGDIVPGNSHYHATLIWSLLHGIALIFSRRSTTPAPFGETTVEALTESFIDQLYVGLHPRQTQ